MFAKLKLVVSRLDSRAHHVNVRGNHDIFMARANLFQFSSSFTKLP